MTRETKVGLLVGLGVILLIGIIVSDHLSVVNEQQAPPLLPQTVQNPPGMEAGPAPLPVAEQTDLVIPPPMADQPPPAPQPAYEANPAQDPLYAARVELRPAELPLTASGDPAIAPPAGQLPPVGPPSRIYHTVKRDESLYGIAQVHYGDGSLWTVIAKANSDKLLNGNHVREGVRLLIPPKPGLESHPDFQPVDDLGRPQPIFPAPGNTASSTAGRTITVEEGDTLSQLASKHLGSRTRMQELFDANRDILRSPDAIYAGMKLRLPSTGSAGSTSSPGAEAGRGATPPATGGTRTYTVQAGDNLMKIARKTLGDGERWQEIYKANRGKLRSPDDIQVGQQLIVPGS